MESGCHRWHIITAVLMMAMFAVAYDTPATAGSTSQAAIGTDHSLIASMPSDADVAYCLGSNEARATWLTNIASLTHERLPTFNITPYEKQALISLATIQKLSSHLSQRGVLDNPNTALPLLSARKSGILHTEQCYADQRPYIACQSKCQDANPTNPYACMKQCHAPTSCTPTVNCPKIENSITP